MSWPRCDNCARSILVHYVRGHLAYCDETKQTRSTFTITEVMLVRRTVGLSITDNMRDLERREKAQV